MTVIIDYGVGNLFSLKSSLNHIGFEAEISGDADIIKKAERIILPGVGAFRDAADKLSSLRLDDVLRESKNSGKPILGICLGLQMLFERSEEFGDHEGLGLLAGSVTKLKSGGLPLPHIAWTSIDVHGGRLLSGIESGEFFYFVHSYCAHAGDKRDEAASAEYGETFTAAAERDNVFGVQFHPEKSGARGLAILKNFMGI